MKLLLELDVLASARYLATLQSTPRAEPERKLMRAVLEDAICCFQKYLLAEDRRGKKIFDRAEEWIFGKKGEYFLSFANVCEMLNLDPNHLRKRLLRWKTLKLQRRRTGGVGRARSKFDSYQVAVH